MINFTIYIEAKIQDAIVERILRTVRHRGYQLRGMELAVHGAAYSMTLTVAGTRGEPYLVKQLEKLVDVESVTSQSEVKYAKTA
jgi:acetolactate synthase II small subunit